MFTIQIRWKILSTRLSPGYLRISLRLLHERKVSLYRYLNTTDVTLSPINTTKELLLDLCVRLATIKRVENEFHVLTGFDGFVDKIQKAVKKKESGKNAYFKTI